MQFYYQLLQALLVQSSLCVYLAQPIRWLVREKKGSFSLSPFNLILSLFPVSDFNARRCVMTGLFATVFVFKFISRPFFFSLLPF